ncbi:MAG: hypothetical protein HY314_10295 [Acidobacteria bacterium]|nr:hypothetical protein [Acidobacteriota bacterium]
MDIETEAVQIAAAMPGWRAVYANLDKRGEIYTIDVAFWEIRASPESYPDSTR